MKSRTTTNRRVKRVMLLPLLAAALLPSTVTASGPVRWKLRPGGAAA
jgi:hypothetical protein